MNDSPVIGWMIDRAHIALPVDLSIYSRQAIVRAVYRLTDRCYTVVQRDPERSDQAVVFLVGRSAAADLQTLALEFHNDLVDQQLRCQLDEQFRDVRTLIVAQAFSEGNLLDPEADEGNYQSDPHGARKHR
jgi:His-Xaa-Ser system protein HxsD